jgi:signal transduction histidine kinase
LREGLAGQAERLGEVARVEREIAYLKNVVTDFLDFARRPAPVLEAVSARELLEEVAELCRGDAKAAITIECSPDLRARADRLQARRALLNLAKNALVAAGPSGRVVLAAGADATGRVVWEVRDSGPGVPSEIAEKIFAPFFTTREKGTGLGLAFVREIARDHGGDATVERAAEGGARFRFTTPVSAS